MAQPNLERLYLRLSERIQDARSSIAETDTGHDFTKAQLVQALNNAVKSFINKIIKEETFTNIAIILEDYTVTGVNIPAGVGGSYPLSDEYIQVVAVRGNSPQVNFDYVKPKDFDGAMVGYNIEENSGTPRWTQIGDKVYAFNVQGLDIVVTAVKKHQDVALGGATDILLDSRFDDTILQLAQADIQTYSPIV